MIASSQISAMKKDVLAKVHTSIERTDRDYMHLRTHEYMCIHTMIVCVYMDTHLSFRAMCLCAWWIGSATAVT